MRIAIIGAGLSGLVAAFEAREKFGQDAHIDVFEAEDRIGGKLRTVAFNDGPVDLGAEAYLARRKDAREFFDRLGLGDAVVAPSGLPSAFYAGGTMGSFPADTIMGIPSTKEEAAAEPIEWEVGGDVNLGELVRARFGEDAYRVTSAMLGGVYSTSADRLGLRATIPHLAAALDRLAKAGEKVTLSAAVDSLLNRRPESDSKDKKSETGTGQNPNPKDAPPIFGAFTGGFATLYEELAEKSGANIHLDSFASDIQRAEGTGFTVSATGAEGIYDRVIVTTPAPTTAVLLRHISPEASAELKKIELNSSAVVGMRFDSDAGLPENSGVIIAEDEGRATRAFTFSSRKWPHLHDQLKDGGALVRASMPDVRGEEDDLVDAALDDLKDITGFDGREAGLSEIFVQRWFGALPLYGPQHGAIVAKVREELANVEGLEATGAWDGGVGVPAVIQSAREAVARL